MLIRQVANATIEKEGDVTELSNEKEAKALILESRLLRKLFELYFLSFQRQACGSLIH